jgi:SAM-dependent methyltransferase
MVKKTKKLKFTEHVKKDVADLLRLDLGSGKGSKGVGDASGEWAKGTFKRVDVVPHESVDVVADLAKPWPWEDGTVGAVNCDYLLHLLSVDARTHFMNELFRVLQPDGAAVVVVPHWCTSKAHLDPRHPPVSEAWFFQLNKAWRDAQNFVDVSGFTCDFDPPGVGYGLHPMVASRNAEYQQHAVSFFKEAAQDLAVTLHKR